MVYPFPHSEIAVFIIKTARTEMVDLVMGTVPVIFLWENISTNVSLGECSNIRHALPCSNQRFYQLHMKVIYQREFICCNNTLKNASKPYLHYRTKQQGKDENRQG